jgi:hypothetical protein
MAVATTMLGLSAVPSQPARAQGVDGLYVGELRCTGVGQATIPLRTQIRLTVSGTTVRYEREVHMPNSSQSSGVKETGTGTVAGSSISMTGGARTATYSYEATYSGTIAGTRLTMQGTQKWYVKQGTENRGCTILGQRQ